MSQLTSNKTVESVVKPVKYKDWYAQQKGRSVEIRHNKTNLLFDVLFPPPDWGQKWGWNFSPDGLGIVFTNA